MSIDVYLFMALLPLVLVPPLIYYRQKVYNKKSQFVSTECPNCHGYEDIIGVQNYMCKHCQTEIHFYDQKGEALNSKPTYNCIHCHQKNFEGILTCVSCGLTNKAGIPSQS